MKMTLFIFLAVMVTISVFAADIVLKDGRVLKDAVVKSQAPRTVTIKHADGLSSVAKTLLPPDLLAQFPLDEMAGQEADKRATVGREAALAYQKSEAERVARVLQERQTSAAMAEASQANDETHLKNELASVKAEAKPLAEHYFQNQYGQNSQDGLTCEVTILEVRRAEGWPNRWFVIGQAVLRRYPSQRTRNTQGMSAKEIQRADTLEGLQNSESHSFEGYYTTEGKEPSINISLR